MDRKINTPLESKFLQLLIEVDPTIATQPNFAREFVGHLASFTEAWANGSTEIDSYERWLGHWLKSSVPSVAEALPAARSVELETRRDVALAGEAEVAED